MGSHGVGVKSRMPERDDAKWDERVCWLARLGWGIRTCTWEQ